MKSTKEKKEVYELQEDIRDLEYYSKHIWRDLFNLVKWLFLATVTGLVVGGISSLFARALKHVTAFRETNPQVFLLLPVAGLIIVFMYQKIGKEDGGTNQVLSTVRSRDDVPFRSAPLIFVSTILTHLTGGSAGR